MADMFFKKCTDLEGAISNSSPTPRKGKGKADAGVFHWVRVTYSMQKSSVGHQQNAGRAFLLNKVLIVMKTFWCLNNIVRFWTKGKENQVLFIQYTGSNDGVKKKGCCKEIQTSMQLSNIFYCSLVLVEINLEDTY